MITVPVHKDVLSYEPKVFLMLTNRTLVFTAAAGGLAIALAAVGMGILGLDSNVLTYVIGFVTLPIWYFGFARPFKMKPEDLAPLWLRQTFISQQLPYVSSPVLEQAADPSGMAGEITSERYPQYAQPQVQRHYEKLRQSRGIEAYDPDERLG